MPGRIGGCFKRERHRTVPERTSRAAPQYVYGDFDLASVAHIQKGENRVYDADSVNGLTGKSGLLAGFRWSRSFS